MQTDQVTEKSQQHVKKVVKPLPEQLFNRVHHIPQSFTSQESQRNPFDGNEILQNFLPIENNLHVQWLNLVKKGREIFAHAETRTIILFVCSGSGEMQQDGSKQIVNAGDTLVVPPKHQVKLVAITDALKVLQMSFDHGPEDLKDFIPLQQRTTLEDLLNYNQQRIKQHVQTPFFKILDDGTLNDQRKLQRFLSCLYVWSSYFQRVMFSRQATCNDRHYQDLFLHHLEEEIGHDRLLAEYYKDFPVSDSILSATSSWFAYKMFVLDNVGKTAIVHLVLEASGDEFHRKARHASVAGTAPQYFNMHAELDDGHAELGMDLLKHHHHHTYTQLFKLVTEAWDMFEALQDRIVFLVKKD